MPKPFEINLLAGIAKISTMTVRKAFETPERVQPVVFDALVRAANQLGIAPPQTNAGKP